MNLRTGLRQSIRASIRSSITAAPATDATDDAFYLPWLELYVDPLAF